MAHSVLTKAAWQVLAGMLLFSAPLPQAARAQSGGTATGVVTGITAGQITYSVANLDLVSDWYVKVMGFKVVRTASPNPDFKVRTLSIPGFAIDLVQQKGSKLGSWPYSRYMQQGYVHFAYYTSDILGSLKILQAANADVTPLKGDNGQVNRLIIHDPEGNEFELFIPPKY